MHLFKVEVLIDKLINDAFRLVPECLRPTSTDDLPEFVLSGITPTELRQNTATLSFACRAQGPNHLLHDRLTSHPYGGHRQLKSRHPLVPVALDLLRYASKLGTSATRWGIAGRALGGRRALLVCINFLMMRTPFYLE